MAAKPVVVDPVTETPVHHHTDACYEEVLVCGLPEHHHTVNCLSDPLDDTQDEDEWLAQTGTTLSGNWADDLLAVAESQLGYEQSERNFQLDDADGVTVRHYTPLRQRLRQPLRPMGRDVPFLLPEICRYPPERYPAGFQRAVFAQPAARCRRLMDPQVSPPRSRTPHCPVR